MTVAVNDGIIATGNAATTISPAVPAPAYARSPQPPTAALDDARSVTTLPT